MKYFFVLMLVLTSHAHAYQCEHFFGDAGKEETLEFLAVNEMKYSSIADFCENHDYMDLELNFMPNYFKFGEEDDDHYKMMIHRAYSSCTYIYNITKKFITDRSCYSTW